MGEGQETVTQKTRPRRKKQANEMAADTINNETSEEGDDKQQHKHQKKRKISRAATFLTGAVVAVGAAAAAKAAAQKDYNNSQKETNGKDNKDDSSSSSPSSFDYHAYGYGRDEEEQNDIVPDGRADNGQSERYTVPAAVTMGAFSRRDEVNNCSPICTYSVLTSNSRDMDISCTPFHPMETTASGSSIRDTNNMGVIQIMGMDSRSKVKHNVGITSIGFNGSAGTTVVTYSTSPNNDNRNSDSRGGDNDNNNEHNTVNRGGSDSQSSNNHNGDGFSG